MDGMTDADADTGKVFVPHMIEERLHAVVSACAAFFSQANRADGQIHIVMRDDQIAGV